MPSADQNEVQDKHGYVAPPSIGHELGVMFGFMAIFLVVIITYWVIWQFSNKRSLKKERERIAAVRQMEANGIGGSAQDEKVALERREAT